MEAKQIKTLSIDLVVVDKDISPRHSLDDDVVATYKWLYEEARDKKEKAELPPLRAYLDADGTYWLTRGFHRTAAARAAGRSSLEYEVVSGDKRAAILDATCDDENSQHGHRWTEKDTRKRIMRLLKDGEWGRWSQQVIAERLRISVMTVRSVASEMRDKEKPDAPAGGDKPPRTKRKVVGTDGKQYPANLERKSGAMDAEAEKARDEVQASILYEQIAPTIVEQVKQLNPSEDELRQLGLLEDAEQVKVMTLVGDKHKTVASAQKAYEHPAPAKGKAKIKHGAASIVDQMIKKQIAPMSRDLNKISHVTGETPQWRTAFELLNNLIDALKALRKT